MEDLEELCPICNGLIYKPCAECTGQGKLWDYNTQEEILCPDCGGAGEIGCTFCAGIGYI